MTVTRAGIIWTVDGLWAAAKIAGDLLATQHLIQVGIDPENVRAGKATFAGSNWFGENSTKKLDEYLEYLLPGIHNRFKVERVGADVDKGLGYAVAHRARMSVIHDETKRFRVNVPLYYQLVVDKVRANTPIEVSDRLQALERVILADVAALSVMHCVYLFQSPFALESVYLGATARSSRGALGRIDFPANHPARQGGNMVLVRVWTVGSEDAAWLLEQCLHQQLEARGLIVLKPSGRSRGSYRLRSDGLELLDGIVKEPIVVGTVGTGHTLLQMYVRGTLGFAKP